MTFGQGKGLGSHQMSEYFDISPVQSLRQHVEVARAADTIEKHTGQCDLWIIISEPCYQRGDRMGRFGGIHHQDDRDI